MAEIESLEVEVEQGGANLEAGDTCAGVITGAKTKTFQHDGDDVTYYELQIEEGGSGIEFTPDWPARITPGTGLGRLVQRFGQELSIGESVDLADIFGAGDRVEFEIDEENGSEEDQTFLVIDGETVRPEGEEVPDADGEEVGDESDESGDDPDGGEEEEETVEDAVLDIVAEMEGDDEADVKKALAKESGDYLKAFKSLVGDEIEVDGDTVSLA